MERAVELDRLLAEHATWLAVERGVAPNTLAAYGRDLGAYAAFLRGRGTVDVGGLTEGDVDAYVEHLRTARDGDGKARYSAASVARAVVAVRSFHRFCLAEGHVGADPSEDVAGPRVPQGIPKALTEAEVEALLGAVTTDLALAGGLNTLSGHVVNPAVAEALHLPATPFAELWGR